MLADLCHCTWQLALGAETCVLLLDRGAAVNPAKGPNRSRPLHWAAQGGHLDVCVLLLERGARVNAEDDDGTQPLHMAAKHGFSDVCMLLDNRGAD